MADTIVIETPVATVLELATQGPQGPAGASGADGAAGQGVPTGGTTGQVLAKASNDNYDTEWVTGGTGGISDAPIDGKTYGRKDAAWEEVQTGNPFDQSLNTDDSVAFNELSFNDTINPSNPLSETFFRQGDTLILNTPSGGIEFTAGGGVVAGEVLATGSIGGGYRAYIDGSGGASFADGAATIDTDGNITAANLGTASAQDVGDFVQPSNLSYRVYLVDGAGVAEANGVYVSTDGATWRKGDWYFLVYGQNPYWSLWGPKNGTPTVYYTTSTSLDPLDYPDECTWSAVLSGDAPAPSLSKTIPQHTHDVADIISGLAAVATSGSASDLTSGTVATERLDLSSAPPIGSTSPNTGAFTTLSSNTSASICGMTMRSTAHPSAGNFSFLVYEGYGGIARFDSSATDFIAIGPTRGIAWSSSTSNAGSNKDTGMYRDGSAGTLGQRYGTTAQEYRIYGTYTSSTNYQRMTVKSIKQTLSALSGASATTTGTFIPDGAVVVGVTTRVATALTGATGYTIGDGTDADRWGDITGTAIGTTSDNRDWTAGTIECFTAGGNITLTAKTSNFTAGAIEICVFYIAGESD